MTARTETEARRAFRAKKMAEMRAMTKTEFRAKVRARAARATRGEFGEMMAEMEAEFEAFCKEG